MMRLTLDRYMSLRAEGRTREQVAEKVGILKSTLRSYLVQWGIADPDREAEMLSEWTTAQALAHQGEDVREARETTAAQTHEPEALRITGFERQVTMTLTEPIMRESLRATADLAHSLARRRGWYEDGGSFAARIARLHADLSAALLASADEGSDAHAANALATVILRALDTAFAHDLDVVKALFDQLYTSGDPPSDAPISLGHGRHVANRVARELPH